MKEKKPEQPKIYAKNIPEELKKISNWLNWRYKWNGKKWTKPPVNGTSIYSSLTFHEALQNTKNDSSLGLGFSIHRNKITGIDLDEVLNRSGKVKKKYRKPLAKIQAGNHYCEISPSGVGLRVFGNGKVKTFGARKKVPVEVYHSGRYLTVTGNLLYKGGRIQKIKKLSKGLVSALYTKRKKQGSLSSKGGESGSFCMKGGAKFQELVKTIWLISPTSYDIWLKVGMAIHYETGGSFTGYKLWDSWSSCSENQYNGSDDTLLRWESFGQQEKGSATVSIGTIRHFVEMATIESGLKKDDPLEKFYEDRGPMVTDFNGQFCVTLMEGKTFVCDYSTKDYRFLDKNSFLTYYGNIFVENEEDPNKPPKGAALMWLKSGIRNSAENVIFDPAELPGYIKEERTFNMWTGFKFSTLKPKKKKGKFGAGWSLMLNHIEKVICNGNKKHFKYLLMWLANIIQNPGGERPGVAVTLYGKKGTGKGTLGSWFGQLLGVHYAYCSSKDDLAGKYNGMLARSIFVFADEAYFPGDKAVEGRLKAIITEPKITMEEKFIPRYQIANHINLLIASNEKWNIPATIDERRFFCLEISDSHMKDIDYFKAINEEMENGGLYAMFMDLCFNVEVNINKLRKAPKTKQLQSQIESNFNAVQSFHKNLKSGEVPIPGSLKDPEKVFKQDVYKAFITYCDHLKMGEYEREDPKSFWIEFYQCCSDFRRTTWTNWKAPQLSYLKRGTFKNRL